MFQNQGLPQPIDRLTGQFVKIVHGNPGFAIPLNVHPVINNYLPYIATLCMEILQSKSQENPLRTLLFNCLSRDYYNNADFMSLVKTVSELAEFRLAQNQNQQIEPLLMQSVADGTEIFTAFQLENFPVLSQMLPPQITQAALSTIGAAKQQFAAIQQYRAGRSYQQNMNQQYAPTPASYFPQAQFQQAPNTYGQQYNPQQPPQQSGIFNYAGSQNPPIMEKQTTVTRATYNVGADANLNPAFSVKTPAPQQETAKQIVQPKETERPAIKVSKKKMRIICRPRATKPVSTNPKLEFLDQQEVNFQENDAFPYDATCDGIRTEKFYLKDDQGFLQPFIQQLTKEETMKREAHLRESNPAASELYRNSNSDLERVEALITTNDWIKTPDVYEEQEEGSLEITKSGVRKTGLSYEEITIAQQTELYELRASKEEQKKAYADIAIAFLPKALVSFKDAKVIAKKFLACENFMEVTNRIKDLLAKANQDNDADLLKIINFFSNRLDKELQSFIHRKLGLDISIESFLSDAVDLISYIERERSPIFSDYLRTHQVQIIENVFATLDEAVAKELDVYWYASEETKDKWNVSLFGIPEVHIYADLTRFDLRIDVDDIDTISKKISTVNYNSVILEKLCKAAYDLIEAEQEKVSKVILTTQEGLRFEINRSFLDSSVYLISSAD